MFVGISILGSTVNLTYIFSKIKRLDLIFKAIGHIRETHRHKAIKQISVISSHHSEREESSLDQ